MIDFLKTDDHIHFFEGGYQRGSLTSRPSVEVDELLCYHSMMKDHHIGSRKWIMMMEHDDGS